MIEYVLIGGARDGAVYQMEHPPLPTVETDDGEVYKRVTHGDVEPAIYHFRPST